MKIKNILLCPNAFKGTFSSLEVAEIFKEEIKNLAKKKNKKVNIIACPMADGGDGTLEIILSQIGGKIVYLKARNPIGKIVKSSMGFIKNKKGSVAIIEMAKISGLTLLKKQERSPYLTTTFGTGELIKKALDLNVSKIIIGIGGSATNDGGVGMAQALGVKFLDINNQEIEIGKKNGYCNKTLTKLYTINFDCIDTRIKKTSIIVFSDVKNKLLGKNGASFIFGKQKGASPSDLIKLDKSLINLNNVVKKCFKKDLSKIIGGGAAGGLGAGLVFFLNAKLVSGSEFVIKLTRLEKRIAESDLIITGEGKLDSQTTFGKAPYIIAKIANKYKKKVITINGILENPSCVFFKNYGTNQLNDFQKTLNKEKLAYYLRRITQKAILEFFKVN